jgi:hypothetical protein
MGFEFSSNRGASTSPRGYAQNGTERKAYFCERRRDTPNSQSPTPKRWNLRIGSWKLGVD